MNDYYVYGYSDPESSEPYFYIGKGRGNRAEKHLQSTELKQQPFLYHKLRKMKELEIEISITFLEEDLTEEQALQKEKEYIVFFGKRCDNTGCLVNITDGGEGISGYRHTEESREKMSLANIGKIAHNYGGQASVDVRIKMSKSRSVQGKENIKKIARKRKGIPICRYDLKTKQVLKAYSCIAQVQEDGYGRAYVRDVLHGKRIEYSGYGWRDLSLVEIEQYKKDGVLS